MADSGALRTRRSRAHAAGDHSLCKRCAAVRSGPPSPGTLPKPPAPPRAVDAKAELKELAARLVAAHEADPGNALLARELRLTLQALAQGGKPADDLEELFAALG